MESIGKTFVPHERLLQRELTSFTEADQSQAVSHFSESGTLKATQGHF